MNRAVMFQRRMALTPIVASPVVSPTTSSVVTLEWDGKDAYGRTVPGSVTAKISVGYEFVVTYSGGTGGQSLGDPGASGSSVGSTSGDRDIGRVLWSRRDVNLGVPSADEDGLGGWTISPHHFFDMSGDGAVYYGDGTVMLGDRLRPTIQLFASTGNTSYSSEGTTALNTDLSVAALAIGPDGLVYLADNFHGSIYRVLKTGAIQRVAGTGTRADFSGSGSATSHQFQDFVGLDVGPDGTIYFATEGFDHSPPNNIVGKVNPDGSFTKILGGSYVLHGTGDGGPVGSATMSEPKAIALGPDGSLFIGEMGDHDVRIRRIAPNGIISRYAGTGSEGANDSTGKASTIGLKSLDDIAVDADGNVFFCEALNYKVRKITPDGLITTVKSGDVGGFRPNRVGLAPDGTLYITAGQGDANTTHQVWRSNPDGTMTAIAGGGVSGANGTPAEVALLLDPRDIAIRSDGSYYVVDGTIGQAVHRVARTLSTQALNEYSLPSADGSEIYYFDPNGRHLRTRNALTGGIIYSFRNDTAGRLLAIYDANGDSTVITRDGSGYPLTIVSPYGLTTTLHLDSDKHLDRITNPNSEAVNLTTGSTTGLLSQLNDAEGNPYTYTYESDGRLKEDSEPPSAGGVQTLSLPDYT